MDKDRPSCSRSHPETEAQSKRSAKAACILVVEDNSGDVALIRQSLSEHGVGLDVVVMTDGEKAIRFMDEVDAGAAPCPALVSLDLNLPKRTGREVLRRIRESRFCRDVPVAIFSSSDDAKDKQEARSLGANRYIKKSSNLEDFLQIGSVLKTLLDEARR